MERNDVQLLHQHVWASETQKFWAKKWQKNVFTILNSKYSKQNIPQDLNISGKTIVNQKGVVETKFRKILEEGRKKKQRKSWKGFQRYWLCSISSARWRLYGYSSIFNLYNKWKVHISFCVYELFHIFSFLNEGTCIPWRQ